MVGVKPSPDAKGVLLVTKKKRGMYKPIDRKKFFRHSWLVINFLQDLSVDQCGFSKSSSNELFLDIVYNGDRIKQIPFENSLLTSGWSRTQHLIGENYKSEYGF